MLSYVIILFYLDIDKEYPSNFPNLWLAINMLLHCCVLHFVWIIIKNQ
jgi:hypothetical protein